MDLMVYMTKTWVELDSILQGVPMSLQSICQRNWTIIIIWLCTWEFYTVKFPLLLLLLFRRESRLSN